MIGSKPDNNVNIVIEDKVVASTNCLKLLGVSRDRHFCFDEQV